MSRFRDPLFLASVQYKTPGNLESRILLHERFSTNPYGWFRWVLDQIELPAGAQILEVGCGSGQLWLKNHDRIPYTWKIILSDFSPGMLNSCRPVLAYQLDRYRFTLSNANAIPFRSATFDAVIANHMLHHIPDISQALAEIARVLKPGGTLYAATNGENHMRELDDLIKQSFDYSDSISLQKPCIDFCLENGAILLAPWFNQVERRDYQDSLLVTEAEPLLAYVHSMISSSNHQGGYSSFPGLERIIKNQLRQQGCIQIKKSSGIFIAKK